MRFDDKLLIDSLLKEIPEFNGYTSSELSFSAYIVFGHFGLFLNKEMFDKKFENKELIERSFNFLNKISDEGNNKVHQMLRVTTFENLTDHLSVIEESKRYLNGKALITFLEAVKFIRG